MKKSTPSGCFFYWHSNSISSFSWGVIRLCRCQTSIFSRQKGSSRSCRVVSPGCPAASAINAATFVGIRIAGLPGAVTATLGCILPSCLIVSLLAWLYRRYKALPLMRSVLSALRPVVVALIAGAGLSLLKNALWQGAPALSAPSLQQAILFAGAFLLLRRKICSPILTMASCGVIYLLVNLP